MTTENDPHKCPKCKAFIFGFYCNICQQDIRDIKIKKQNEEILKNSDLPDCFKDIFR